MHAAMVVPAITSELSFLSLIQRCAPASIRLMDNWQFQMGTVQLVLIQTFQGGKNVWVL